MDTTKFTMGIVGLVVIILMVTGAVLPAVENAQAEQATTANNTDMRYTASLDPVGQYVVESKTDGLYVNDKLACLIPTGSNYFFVIRGNDFTAAYTTTGALVMSIISTGLTSTISLDSGDKFIFDNGTVSRFEADDSSTTTVTTYSYLVIPDSVGKYGLFTLGGGHFFHINANVPLYLLMASTSVNSSYSGGNTFIETNSAGQIKKNVTTYLSDGSLVTDSSTAGLSATLTSTMIGDIDIKVTGISFNSTSASGATTVTYALAPVEYKFIDSEDAQYRALFAIIPLLLIIVAVLYAVRLMGASRN